MATSLSQTLSASPPISLPAGWTISGKDFADGLTHSWVVSHPTHGQGLLKYYKGWSLAPDEVGEFNQWFAKRRIHHPGWPLEHASGLCRGVPWVIEHMRKGRTLREIMAKTGRPPVLEAVSTAMAVGKILEVAHQSGLNHGAVGSEMVVIQDNTDEPFLLLEIGVIPHVVQGGPERLKAVVGNPIHYRFMAPETLQGRGVTNFSDVFSLGTLLYWMLTGEYPFPGDSPEEIMANQSQKPPRTPPELRMGVPLPLSQLVMRMIAFQQGHRLKNMAEINSQLERIAKIGAEITAEGYDVNTGAGRPAPGSSESVRLELEQLDKHLFQHPNDCASHYKKALAHQRLGDYPKAIAACTAAITHNPRLGHAWQLRAQCLMDSDEPRKALEDWNRLAKGLPNNPLFHVRRAQALVRLHEMEQAAQAIAAAKKADPQFEETHLAQAEYLKFKKLYDAAKDELEKILSKHPNHAEALCLRSEIKVRLKDHQGALADVTKAADTNPAHAASRAAKVRQLMAMGRAEDASEDVDKLLALQPDSLDNRLLRIRQRCEIGDFSTALEDTEAAPVKPKPGDEILRHRAWLLAVAPDSELRDPKEALEIARQGCDATGWADPDWLETVAAAYSSLGQFEGAVGWQTKALAILEESALPVQKKRLDLYKAHKSYRLGK